jgi:pectate lyase-like protein
MAQVEHDAGVSVPPANALNVRDFGAKGEGQEDESKAIQKALDAVGSGNMVFFPPGNYKIERPLKPKSQTQLVGVHVPSYGTGPTALSACKIGLGDKFVGEGAIAYDSNDPGGFAVEIKNLAFDDQRTSKRSVVHGIRLPDRAQRAGERSWNLEHVTIHGFNGSGLFGRWQVATFYDVHVACNAGWGVNANDNGNNWNDIRFVACQFYFNGQGNVWLGGKEDRSAAIEFIGCRSERAGIVRGAVSTSTIGAPGWRISRGARINLVGCSTDANAGNGVEIVPLQGDDAANLYLIQIVGSSFGRDGCLGKDGVPPSSAGVKVDSANQVRIVGCSINTGDGKDPTHPDAPAAGEVGYVVGPKYGMWCRDIQFVDIVANSVSGVEKNFLIENIKLGPKAYRCNIQDMRNGLFTIPDRAMNLKAEIPDPSTCQRGMTVWNVTTNKPLWWDGQSWRDALGQVVTVGPASGDS